MIARLVRSEDFDRVLRTRSCGSSAHFAVHHMPDRPGRSARALAAAAKSELSTDRPSENERPVDDRPAIGPDTVWLGAVVPKRHARRAVTRTLLKRQIRAVVDRHRQALDAGLWVVRLRAPFDRSAFVSAASELLKVAVRDELDRLMRQAVRPRSAH